MKNLRDLLEDQLKDIYSAENQVSKALPKLAKAAKDETLKKAFKDHLEETKSQIERLKRIASAMDFTLGGEHCEAAEGLIKEGESVIEDHEAGPTRDAGLITAAQRFEHYEMAAYGTARDFAKELGLTTEAKLLQEILDEESEANELLTKIAHSGVNRASAQVKSNGNGSSSRPNLKEMSVDELYELAQEKEIEGRSNMNKKDLIKALS